MSLRRGSGVGMGVRRRGRGVASIFIVANLTPPWGKTGLDSLGRKRKTFFCSKQLNKSHIWNISSDSETFFQKLFLITF